MLNSIQIYSAKKEFAEHDLEIGSIVSTKKELKVAVANGYIIITEIKLPGKKMMDAKSLLNGYAFEDDAKML